jgi:hypothetical protein
VWYFFYRLILTCALASCPGAGLAAAHGDSRTEGARTIPPPGLACDRSQLTSYSGSVAAYERRGEFTRLLIHTDWDSREPVTVVHPEGEAAERYLFEGKAFRQEHWKQIESASGVLLPDVRVTAWVCEDGITPAVIDWRPGSDREGRRLDR